MNVGFCSSAAKKTSCENSFNLFCNLFLGSAGFYTLENLQPTTTYDLRFASKNLVGFSEWGAGKQLTMPQRGPPEKPRISTMVKQSLKFFKNTFIASLDKVEKI